MKKRLLSWLMSISMLLSMVAVPTVAAADISQVIYVLGTYSVHEKDNYGNGLNKYYAQGVDMNGKEVSVLIGVERLVYDEFVNSYVGETLGETVMYNGFYTFELSSETDEKTAGILVAEALDPAYNGDAGSVYTGFLERQDFSSKTVAVRTYDMEKACLTEDTRFILVDGSTVGSELETAVLTGSIYKDGVTAPVILSRSADGSVTLEAVVLDESLHIMAEDLIYVTPEQLDLATVTGNGIEYTVYRGRKQETETIVLEDELWEAGFYGYSIHAVTNEYVLWRCTESNVSERQELLNCYQNLLLTTDVDYYDASGAVIVDTRSDVVKRESNVGTITTLDQLRYLIGDQEERSVQLDLWLDADEETVQAIYVTDVSDGFGPGIPTEEEPEIPGSSGTMPAGPQRPENIVQVTDVSIAAGQEYVTLENYGVLSNTAQNDVVDEYDIVNVGDWVLVEQQGERYTLTQLKAASGFITANQATGCDYTEVAGLAVDLETGLDMIGHYVTAYYVEEYRSEAEPGIAYCVADEATYVKVDADEPADTKKEYQAFFGTKRIPTADVINVVSGTYTTTEEESIAGYDVSGENWVAANGTYVIYEGKVIGFIANATKTLSRVTSVTTRYIRVGVTTMQNNADEDVVNEYDDIAKGDIVVIEEANGIYTLTKAEKIEGKITRYSAPGVAVDEMFITVNGTKYERFVASDRGTGLNNDPYTIDFDTTYEIYVVDGKYIGWTRVAAVTNISDVIYVVGTYTLEGASDAYGNRTNSFYAQGVDMNGKEVSILIGVEKLNQSGYLTEILGVATMGGGFYTFELSRDKDAQKANVMVATPIATLAEDEGICAGTIYGEDFDSKTAYVEIAWDIAWDIAFVEPTTKFIIVDGSTIGSELETAVVTGSINRDNVDAPVLLSKDADGNLTLEVVLIDAPVYFMGEDYIYVSADQMAECSAVDAGWEYTVYFTGTNENKTIIADWRIDHAGFYCYCTEVVDGVTVYILDEVCEADFIVSGTELFRMNGTKLITDSILALEAAGAAVVDVRSSEDKLFAEVGAITTLDQLAYLVSSEEGRTVTLDALLDEELGSITNIFVTWVSEGFGPGIPVDQEPVDVGGSRVLPAGPQRPTNITSVTSVKTLVGRESITLEGYGLMNNNIQSDVVDEYQGIAVGDWVLVEQQGERYKLTRLKAASGIITENQASGMECTLLSSGGYFGIETGLDMLGRYVTVYYESEYKNQSEPGVTHAIVDEGTTVWVDPRCSIDTKRECQAVFGNIRYPVANQSMVFDGRYVASWSDTGIAGYSPEMYTARAGTYVIYEGQIVSYLTPPALTATKVLQVNTTTGKESITLVGYGVMSNTVDDDCVVEYEGIAKGDIVVVKEVHDLYRLEKAEMVTDMITRTSVNDYDEYVITVGEKQYVQAGMNMAMTGLANNSDYISFDKIYEIYTYGGSYIGWKKAVSAINVSDVVYVLGTYFVEKTDAYGNIMTNIYAHGVDMTGKEVSILVGFSRYEYGYEELLGVNEVSAGYYTFKLSTDKYEKNLGIMVAEALASEYDAEEPNLYVGFVRDDMQVTGKTTNVPTAAGERAFLESDSRFVAVDGRPGNRLDTVVLVGGVDQLYVYGGSPVLVERDSDGNTILCALVVFEDIDNLQADAVYVTEAQMQPVGQSAEGYLFEVYDADSGELREVTIEQMNPFTAPGFYSLEEVDWNVYTAQAYHGVCVKESQEILNWQDGVLTTTDLVNCPANQSIVVDTRNREEAEESGCEPVGDRMELQMLCDERYANCRVTVDVWKDMTTGEAKAIYVTEVQPRINGLYQYAYVYGTKVDEAQQKMEAWGVRASAQQADGLLVGTGETGLAAGVYLVGQPAQDGTVVLERVTETGEQYYAQDTLVDSGFALDSATAAIPLEDGTAALITESTAFVYIEGSDPAQAQVTVDVGSTQYRFNGEQVTVLLSKTDAGDVVAHVVYLCRFGRDGAVNVASGCCGEGMSWAFMDNGTLYITGNQGVMNDYSGEKRAPWHDYANKITAVKLEGVVGIGSNAFADCTALTQVKLPAEVDKLGDKVFSGCAALTRVEFEGNAPSQVGQQVFEGTGESIAVYCDAQSTGWTNAGYDAETITWNGVALRKDTTYTIRYLCQMVDTYGYEVVQEQTIAAVSGDLAEIPSAIYEGFAENIQQSTVSGRVAPDGTLELERRYDRCTYTITFYTEGDPQLQPITALFGAAVTLPGAERYGYQFDGWYTDEGLTQPCQLATMPLNGAKLYPKWSSIELGRGMEYTIDRLVLRDEANKQLLNAIPDKDFLVEVQVTNQSSTHSDTLLLVTYTKEGQMLDMHYMYASVGKAEQMTFGTLIHNEEGLVGKVKVFVLTHLGGQALAKSVERQ